MANLPQHVILRAQEIAAAATEPITTDECAVRAALEFYGDDREAMARALVSSAGKAFRKALDADQDLPDDGDGEQLSFFPDSRSWIIVQRPEGDVVIPKAHQTLGDVETWARQRRSHHRVQSARFDRMVDAIDTYADGVDRDRLWPDVRPELQKAKTEALTQGTSDDDHDPLVSA